MWEIKESMRQGIPWEALSVSSPVYPKLCSSVAQVLRSLADTVDVEAKVASAGGNDSPNGPVAGALGELGVEFVKHRMPPILHAEHGVESGIVVNPSSCICVVDPLSFAMVPVPGTEDGSVKLVHCIKNPRETHMMGAPPEVDDDLGSDEGEEE